MQIKILYCGLQSGLPKLPLQLGAGLISVWVDNAGFTSASNDLGALGYVYLDAPQVDVPVDPDTETAFQDLHGRIVQFDIAPSKFVRDGGIARITMTLPGNGDDPERSVAFSVSGCRGIAITSGALTFTVEMLQLDRSVAEITDGVSEDDFVAMIDNAPTDDDEVPA